jgi:outer membrane biosynthesis protein TonB
MHKYLLTAAIILCSTAAQAGMSRGLTLVTNTQSASAPSIPSQSNNATSMPQTAAANAAGQLQNQPSPQPPAQPVPPLPPQAQPQPQAQTVPPLPPQPQPQAQPQPPAQPQIQTTRAITPVANATAKARAVKPTAHLTIETRIRRALRRYGLL